MEIRPAVAQLFEGPHVAGNVGFQRHDAGRPRGGVVHAGQLKQFRDVRPVGFSAGPRGRVRSQIGVWTCQPQHRLADVLLIEMNAPSAFGREYVDRHDRTGRRVGHQPGDVVAGLACQDTPKRRPHVF
jgi:hypothetical protein